MALWDLITNDQEVYDAFYYGIEGTSYELNDEGQFKILDTDNYGTSAMWSARSDALNRQQMQNLVWLITSPRWKQQVSRL